MADTVNIKDASNVTVPIGSDEVTIAGLLQQLQRMKLYDGADGSTTPIGAFPTGFLRVTDEPRALLNENYDTLDTTNTWTLTNGGSGVVPSLVSGALSLATTTTAASYSRIQSKYQFKIPAPGWKVIAQAVALPDGASPIANSYRFWGEGVTSGTPTATAPLTDAIGFEMGTDGHLRCVVYKSGTRTVVADLFGTVQPTDVNNHLYIIFIRTHKVYFYIDGINTDNLVATGNFTYPSQQSLPICNMAIAGTGIASSASMTILGTSLSDTTKQNVTVGDPDQPWRRVKVSEYGGMSIGGSQTPVSTASWTSGTGTLNTALTLNITNLNTVTVAAISTTTITNGVLAFEVSMDGTNWIPIVMARIDTMGVESSYAVTANTARAWSTSVDGFAYFRVRISTAIAGTGTVSVALAAQALPIEPVVNATIIPNTSGGLTPFHLVSAATTNATNIKASAGQVFGWYIYNSNAAARKVTFHNSATAPTAGANVLFSLIIPPSAGANVMSDTGIAFSAGIGITTTTDLTDAGTTAVALNDLNINIFYK